MKISAGGEIDFELLEDTLPSLSSARDTYGSVRFIQNSFLGQGVDVEEHLNWKEDSEDELNLESIHWVIDRKEMPRNKVLEGFVTDDGTYRSSTPLGVLNTQVSK